MSQIALYRKYRPNSFSEVIGQEMIIRTLKNAINNNNFFHSYVFSGTHGSGKTSIARIFAKALNCLNPVDGDCCNKCKNCTLFNTSQTIDIVEIDAASNSGVEEVRKIIEYIEYQPIQLRKKIYIIDEAHMLSTTAWNALLKTIEEPPEHAIFIFATTEVNKILPTIMSRCQRFNFSKLTNEQLNTLIDNVCHIEGILIANDAKHKITLLSNGSARDCLSILHQISNYTNNSITIEALGEVFGFVDLNTKINFLNLFANNQIDEMLKMLEKITNNYLLLAHELIEIVLDKLTYLKTTNPNFLQVLTLTNLYDLNLDEDQCRFLLKSFQEIYEKIKQFDQGLFYFQSYLLSNTKYNTQEKKQQSTKMDIKPNLSSKLPSNHSTTSDKPSIQFNASNLFKTSILGVHNKERFEFGLQNIVQHVKPKPKKSLTPNLNDNQAPLVSIDYQSLFNSIAHPQNTNLELKKLFSELLESAKFINNSSLTPLLCASKILTASSNGVLVLFSFKSELDEFQNWYWHQGGYKTISEFIHRPVVVLGCVKELIAMWKKNINVDSLVEDVDISKYFSDLVISDDEKIEKILAIYNREEK